MLAVFATTIIQRPYVLLFLIAYIYIALKFAGRFWTFAYLLAGYSIAFISEFCSINYGIPYGWYYYVYENLKGEWLNLGVPVWDSVSYVFMNFSGLCVARFFWRHQSIETTRAKIILVLTSAVFVTLLDVVIDPIAHLGEQWFLGKIYFYPNPGNYFDVTFTNFVGWFFVSACINGLGVFVLQPPFLKQYKEQTWFLPLGLYYGIFGFGLTVAIYLQQWLLVFCDLCWISLTVLAITQGSNRLHHRDYLAKSHRRL